MREWPTDRLLLGGDYNPEQWPDETLEDDVARMREAGVTFATVGVFSWALLEPEPGRYETAWLDRVLDRLHEAEIVVDLATATASAPPWFARLHPDAMPVTRDGLRLAHGSRQTWCPSSPDFRRRSLELVRELAERYRDHPALAMWHVGNEFGCHNLMCFCETSAEHFRAWLMTRYDDLDGLNAAWGTSFWSQRYTDVADVVPPRTTTAIPNPTAELDWRRFSSDASLAQHVAERDLLHELSPGVPVTTNFMVGFSFDGLDYWRWAPHQDVISNDHYRGAHLPHPEVDLALSADVTRGLAGGDPWVLMEHSTSAVNWQPVNPVKPQGQMLRDSLSHVARGADSVGFFQWRASAAGAEKYHSALLPHAGTDTRRFREVVELGRVLAACAEVAGSRTESRVALVMDYESWWTTDADSVPTVHHRYLEEVRGWYEAAWRAGLTVTGVQADGDLTGYGVVLAPACTWSPTPVPRISPPPPRPGPRCCSRTSPAPSTPTTTSVSGATPVRSATCSGSGSRSSPRCYRRRPRRCAPRPARRCPAWTGPPARSGRSGCRRWTAPTSWPRSRTGPRRATPPSPAVAPAAAAAQPTGAAQPARAGLGTARPGWNRTRPTPCWPPSSPRPVWSR